MSQWCSRIIAGFLVPLLVSMVLVLWSGRDLAEAEYLTRHYPDVAPETVIIDGVRLRYQLEGEGPAVVLIHSHFFTMQQWDAIVDALKDEYTLVRFDMTSHGLTGADPSGNYTMARGVELISGLLDELGLERVHLVGSSLGGTMAFNYAAQHPERVKRLVLINTGGGISNSSRDGSEMPVWAGAAIRLVPRWLYRKFLTWMFIDDALVTDDLLARFHDGFRREGNRPAEIKRLRDYKADDPAPVLEKVTAPTLLLWGGEDPQLPVDLSGQFSEQLVNAPSVELVSVPRAGHVLALERPDLTARYLQAFLRGEKPGKERLAGEGPGPFSVKRGPVVLLTHNDGRKIKARASWPSGDGPFPLMLFSHGFASGKDQYDVLIRHWVSHGYVVLAPDHADSGSTAAAILASLKLGKIGLVKSRANDLALLLASLDQFHGLAQLADPGKLVAAGHSFGAFTAQMLSGAAAVDKEGERHGWSGPAPVATVAISPPGEMFDVIVADSWTTMRGPVLMTTSMQDTDGRFVTDWRQHLLSYKQAEAGNQHALVLDGADHYFGGLICRLDEPVAGQHEALVWVQAVSTAFLSAEVKGAEFPSATEISRASDGFAELYRR